MASDTGLFASLKHRDYRWLVSAFTLSDIGSWAYQVALVVWVFDATGSVTWLAATTVCRFVPALVFSAYAGVLADRFEKVRLLCSVDLLFAVVMAAMAVQMMLDAPVYGVVALAAVSSTLSTVYEPAAAALTPHVVSEQDLASANALRNTIENVTVIAGPGLGALLLLTGPPEVAVWINAASFVLSALLVSRVRVRTKAADVTEGGTQGPLKQMLVGLKAIGAVPATVVLVAYSALATMVFGVDTVLFVAISDEVLGTGPNGYGYLLAGLGAGGIAAAPFVTRAEGRSALGPVILVGMAAYCLPTLLFLVTTSPGVAFGVQVVRGAGTMFVDVLAITALQRTLSGDVLARVFGAFNSLMLAAILVGSLLTPWVLGAFGVHAAIWAAGAGIFAISLLGLPWLRQMDRAAASRRDDLAAQVAIIEACDLFDRVPDGGIVQLAAASQEQSFVPGRPVVVQDEVADAFYIVVEGQLRVSGVSPEGRTIDVPDLGPGDWFGEIGLIERIARTASVSATTPTTVLRIDGAVFVDALTAGTPSAAIMDGAALRLGRTHPALAMSRAGLSQHLSENLPENKETTT